MPKYKVAHSLLSSPERNFRQGEIVTEKDLKDATFDLDFLLKNEAIHPLEGTEDAAPVPPSNNQDAAAPGENIPALQAAAQQPGRASEPTPAAPAPAAKPAPVDKGK